MGPDITVRPGPRKVDILTGRLAAQAVTYSPRSDVSGHHNRPERLSSDTAVSPLVRPGGSECDTNALAASGPGDMSMVLDTATLRIAFGLMALALVFLFYFCTYRPTRSPYSGWWCVALLFFLTGSVCFLLNKTEHQVWANPMGNVLLVTGALAVWAGARSLRPVRPPGLAFVGMPLLTLVASALDSPATNMWSGGPFSWGS